MAQARSQIFSASFLRLATLCTLWIGASGCGSSGDGAPPTYVPSLYAVEKLQEALDQSAAGNVREAMDSVNAAIEDDPRFPEPQYWKSALFVRMGRFEDARVTLYRLFEIAPEHPEARMLHGLLLEKAGLIPEARSSYEIAVRTYQERLAAGQDNPGNMLEHAIALYLLRGRTVGLQNISEVLKAYPDYQPAQFVRSRISADDREFFLRQAIQPNRRSALSSTMPMPISESADTALSSDLLEPLSLPNDQ